MRKHDPAPGRVRVTARAQGAYFVASGIWPIVSPGSFQRVTGPKADMWLAQTVGGLITAVGLCLLRPSADTEGQRVLGLGSAIALGTADLVFALNGRIRRVYLIDALIQAAFVAGYAEQRSAQSDHTPSSICG